MNQEPRVLNFASFRQPRFWGLLAVILIGAAMRLLPHPPNFSPIAAMALFGGAYFGSRALAIVLPLAALALSDLALGWHDTWIAVYGSFVLVALLGLQLRSGGIRAGRVALASVLGSLLFFVITNLAVWVQSGMYAHTTEGLVACFVAALPFLQNSLAGDLFFNAVFFAGWAFVERSAPRLREA